MIYQGAIRNGRLLFIAINHGLWYNVVNVKIICVILLEGDATMAKSLIYHGSYTEIQQPEIRKGRNTKDFGTGFYCTLIQEQAERWAKRYDIPTVNVYSMLINEDLNILEFPSMTEAWLDFIVACRNGESHNYDIVIGAMANDQIYNYISDFVAGDITRKQFWTMARFKYPTHQINFCTQEALKCLKFEYSRVVNKNDRTRR